jgi:hypothetical protein
VGRPDQNNRLLAALRPALEAMRGAPT